ncbi:MAG: TolC family protein [Rhodothermales bacterium]
MFRSHSVLPALWPAILITLFSTGCASQRDAGWVDKRPLGADVTSYRPSHRSVAVDSGAMDTTTPPLVADSLTLEQALAMTLLRSPRLRAFGWEVRAREAAALQAAIPPNPELASDLDNFGGTGRASGSSIAEATIGLSQLVHFGGDRRTGYRVAALERNLAGWDFEAARLDVLTSTTQAFITVLAGQERLSLADSLLSQATNFYNSVAARVEAGKVSALEERRASIVLASSEIAREQVARILAVDRARLAAIWGSPAPLLNRAVGDLTLVPPIPSFEIVQSFLERNPDVERWKDEMAVRRADVLHARAQGIPDPIFTLGARRMHELNETSIVASVSIPLPLFDRNQGRIKETRYRLRQGEEQRRAVTVMANEMLVDAFQRLASASSEITALRESILPSARENFSATQEGYRDGKFDLLTVLDAQRTFFEAANQQIDVLETYHNARAEVERLIGTPLIDIL